MRKHIIAGNWKMNHGPREALDFLEGLSFNPREDQRVILCPPFVSLPFMLEKLPAGIELAAQNIHQEEKGAYTGEIAASMIREMGVSMTLVGHSERRADFHESHEIVEKKVRRALTHGLEVILCVGEQLHEKEAGEAKNVVAKQLLSALESLEPEAMKSIHVAYEPVWAIGTGKTASAEDAQEMNHFIRRLLTQRFGEELAQKVSLLYGGSVHPGNIKELMAMEDIDGALVGGASLDPESFAKLLEY